MAFIQIKKIEISPYIENSKIIKMYKFLKEKDNSNELIKEYKDSKYFVKQLQKL